MTSNQLALCLIAIHQRKLNAVATAHAAAVARKEARQREARRRVQPYVDKAA
jgi:hypothetical protein